MSTSLTSHQENVLFDTPFGLPTDEGRAKLFLALIAALAVVALCLSGYLSWTTWSAGSMAGCTGDGLIDCDHVLASHWSKWLGLPVSLLGSLTYIGILAACWPAARHSQGLALSILLTLSLMAAGSAVWFIGLQIVVLQSFCIYCMAVHTCGLSIGVLTLFFVREATAGSKDDQMRALLGVANVSQPSNEQSEIATQYRLYPLVAMGIAAVGLTVLMGGQYFFQPAGLVLERIAKAPASSDIESTVAETTSAGVGDAAPAGDLAADRGEMSEPAEIGFDSNTDGPDNLASIVDKDHPEKSSTPTEEVPSSASRLIAFNGLSEPVDVYDVPVLGNPEAEHVLVEMMDYTCTHCRHLHHHVHAALERYGDQVAFVVYHAPLSKRCNPHVQRDRPVHVHACDYARLALGVWKLDQTKFVEFHDWLMESKKAPSVFEARQKAMKLVGEKILLDKALKADLFRGFASNSDVVKEVRSGLPLLLSEDGIIRGYPKNEGEWFMFLEELLGVEPLAELSE